jgi:DNA-binding XRE family transcriptional regulator
MTPADLKQRRHDLGLSQTALAQILGVRRPTISDWETGKQAIPPMLRLAFWAIEKGAK